MAEHPAHLDSPGERTVGVLEVTPGHAEDVDGAGGRARRLAAAWLLGAAWMTVGALGILAVLRWLAWDAAEPLIVADALTPLLYLPAWAVLGGAVSTRRWLLAGAAAMVAAAQVAFVAPELLAAGPVPAWADHAPTLRVLDANVDKSPTFEAGYRRALMVDHPDVVAFEEFTPTALASLETSGALRSLPYRCAEPAFGAVGLFAAARWPLTGCRVDSVLRDGGRAPFMLSATLATPGGPVALRVVHTLAPLPAYWHQWVAALTALDRSVGVSGVHRMLMVGDFNATWGNRGFAALLADGLVDGAAARGQALAMTWPDGAVVPPFVRIDHVLTGPGVAVTRIAAHAGFGSDHHYLTATVAIGR